MTWQPQTFTPDSAAPSNPAPWMPSSFVPDPHATGQEAAQGANVKPTAPLPPNNPPPLPQEQPAGPSGDEPSLSAPTPLPVSRAQMAQPPEVQATSPTSASAQDVKNQQDYTARVNVVSNAVGGKFDPKQGVENAWDATRLAWMDQMADRAKYLQDKGYDAKVINIPGSGPMTVFKPKDSDTWRPIDGSNWSMGDIGRVAAQTPALATQIGTTLATDGASLPLRMGAQVLTGGAEKIAEELANKAAGSNSGGFLENAGDAAKAGGRSSIGELVGSLIGYGSNAVKGTQKGFFAPTNEGQEVLNAADRLNAANPKTPVNVTPGAVGAPILALREKQIAPLSVTMQNAYDKIRQNLSGMVENKASGLSGGAAPAIGDADSTVGSTTYPGLESVRNNTVEDAASALAGQVPVTEQSQGGSALRQGADTLKQGLTSRTAAKYGDIPDQGTTFDITPLQNTAADMEKGIKAKGYPKTTTTVEEPSAINAGLEGAQPVTRTTETPTTVTLGETPAGYMGNIVSKVKQMFPQMEEIEGRTPYEQLQNLRTKIGYAASEYPVGGNPAQIAEFHQARQLLGSLDNVLANPQGANASNFAAKLKSAQLAAKTQNTILDNPMIQKIRNSQVPPEDLMQYASPGNFTNLQLLKRTMPPEDFGRFQDAWASSLVRNPDRIPGALKAFNSDPRALGLLADSGRQKVLTDYAAAMDKINGSPITSMMAEKNFASRPGLALNSKDADGIADLIKRAGGPNSPIGLNLRAAVFKSVIQSSKEMGAVDLNKTAQAADKMLNSDTAAKILTSDDTQMLQDIRTVANAQGKTANPDMQGGLAAGHAAGFIKNPLIAMLEPIKTAKGVGNLLEAWLQAKMWSNPLGRRMMVGTGPGASIAQRVAGALGADAAVPQPNKEPEVLKPSAP